MKRLLTLSLAGLLTLAGGASAHGYGAFRAAIFQPVYAAPLYAPAVVAASPVVVQQQAAPCPAYGQILSALAASAAQAQAAPAAAQPQAVAVQPYAAPAVAAAAAPAYAYGGVSAFAAPAYGYGARAFAAPVVVRRRVFAQPVVAADVALVRQAAVVVRRGGVFPTIGRFLFGRRVVAGAPAAAVVAPARGVNVVAPGIRVRVR
jgi:hypothetical protein